MHATMTTTRGSTEDMASVAVITGEAMAAWLRDIEGFVGLVFLTDEATGTARVIAFWESEEVAERHRAARLRLRDRITATVDVEVQETVAYDVPFTDLPGLTGT
jgi:Antibiotic biosynthesis monooxygenase